MVAVAALCQCCGKEIVDSVHFSIQCTNTKCKKWTHNFCADISEDSLEDRAPDFECVRCAERRVNITSAVTHAVTVKAPRMGSERKLEEILQKLKTLDALEKKIDKLSGVVAGFDTRLKGLEEKFDRSQQQVSSLQESVQRVQSELLQFEIYTRKNNIEINGIPEVADENLMELIVKLAGALSVNLSVNNIDIVHRINSRNTSKPKPIILKLTNRWKKEELMLAANDWRKKTSSQLRVPPTTTALGLNLPQSDIYINDHLSPYQRRLHTEARVLRNKLGGYSAGAAVWIKKGVIYIRRSKDSSAVRIQQLDQLEKLSHDWKDYFKQ